MHKHIKNKLIKALKSGEYKKTEGQLRNFNAFCCLGVLCNLHAQAHPEIAKRQTAINGYMGHSGSLSDAVQKWAGMNTCDGRLSPHMGSPSLASINDCSTTFKPVIEAIKENWKTI